MLTPQDVRAAQFEKNIRGGPKRWTVSWIK